MQLLTFVRGGGVEFLPDVDDLGIRLAFIRRLCAENRLSIKLRSTILQTCKQGRVLLFLRPNGRSYKIESYPKSSYQAIYDGDGEPESAIVIYSYQVRQSGGEAKPRWVWLRISAGQIEKKEQDQRPRFEDTSLVPDTVIPNSLGFFPCVEILNPAPGSETLGESDFSALAAQIDVLDGLTQNIAENLEFLACSPILTTRDAGEVSEAAMMGANRGVSDVSGFLDANPEPFSHRNRQRKKLKSVIGGIESDELFQQLQIYPLPPNQLAYAESYERQLREALGGVLERGLETATESRLVYGKVQVTAREKQEAIFTYGYCKILELALLAEESIYLASDGAMGLPPLGDRTVSFRVAPVFVQTTRDRLDQSIVGRNLQELGVSSKETLKFVFPDKKESEIDAMVGTSGIPFRFLNQTLMAFQQLAALMDPITLTPLADPRTGLPLLYSLVPALIESLNYGNQFTAGSEPGAAAPAAAELAAYAAALARIAAAERPSSGPAGPTDQPPTVSGAGSPIPSPGSTTAAPAAPTGGGFLDFSRSPILNAIRRSGGR
jgi:hypothetical protein